VATSPSLTRRAGALRVPPSERLSVWLALSALAAVGVGVLAQDNPRLLVDIVIVVAFVLLFLRWPWAMLLLIMVAGFKDNEALEFFTFAGAGIAVMLRAPRVMRSFVALCFLALLLVALRALPLAPTFADGLKPSQLYVPFTAIPYLGSVSDEAVEWGRLGFLFVAFLLGAWLIRDRRRLSQAVTVTLASATIPIAYGLVQYAQGNFVLRPGSSTKAVEGPFSHPNYFAFYLLTTLLVGLVMLLEARTTRARVALLALTGSAGFCLLLTYTRSAWIAFAVGVVLLGIFRYRSLIVIGAIGVVVAVFAAPGTVRLVNQRFGDLSSSSAARARNSLDWRTGQWNRLLPYGLHHPFSGTGFGSYQADTVREFGFETPSYSTLVDPKHPVQSPKGFTAHNDYVRMIVELGFPGVVLWSLVLLGLLGSMIAAARAPNVRPEALALSAVAVALIGISGSDNVQGYTMDLFYPLVLAGGVMTVARQERSRRPASTGRPL
jgi:O-antigen ligase